MEGYNLLHLEKELFVFQLSLDLVFNVDVDMGIFLECEFFKELYVFYQLKVDGTDLLFEGGVVHV